MSERSFYEERAKREAKAAVEAVEAEEPATEDETSRIKDLIAALGG